MTDAMEDFGQEPSVEYTPVVTDPTVIEASAPEGEPLYSLSQAELNEFAASVRAALIGELKAKLNGMGMIRIDDLHVILDKLA